MSDRETFWEATIRVEAGILNDALESDGCHQC
jgi:hypothetical protein